jgi:hypothetical protein
MSIEGGRSFEQPRSRPIESPEAVRARREDARVRALLADPEANTTLFKTDVISWLKGSIGLNTERGASAISDEELMTRYMEGGKVEWDPLVKKGVAAYLKQKGFTWSS